MIEDKCPYCGQNAFILPAMDATFYPCGTVYWWMSCEVTFSDRCIENQNKNKKE